MVSLAAARGVFDDDIHKPKSELYEKSSEYLRDKGYTVRVFNLVSPENSDSWNSRSSSTARSPIQIKIP